VTHIELDVSDIATSPKQNLSTTRWYCVITDRGSGSNLISKQLVHKTNLPTNRHPQPYAASWVLEKNTEVIIGGWSLKCVGSNPHSTLSLIWSYARLFKSII